MKMKLKRDNRGASLVMVVCVVTIVAILVTIALALGLLNYQMKVTNRNSKNNFYDAERVLDEIRLGLQNDVSLVMSDAYYQTLEDYADKDLKEAEEYFEDLYTEQLRERLKSSGDKRYYDMDYLLSFLDSRVKKNTKLEPPEGKKAVLSVNSDGVTLKNLYLTYIDEKEYISRVATDIQIRIPDLNFSKFQSTSNVVQYALIAQKGVYFNSKTTTLNLNGNVYAGSSTTANGFVVNNGDTVNLLNGKDLVTSDTVTVKAGGRLNQEEKATVWTKDIVSENNSNLTLQGNTYVANDLTLFGSANVTLGGEYYGFGNPRAALQAASIQDLKLQSDVDDSPADYSSSIIVNGIGTSGKARLNLKDSETLMLAGNAYVGDSKVFMGESLTVKSNQIAYLVPESCMMGASNPMTEAMHTEMLKGVSGETEKDQEVNFRNQILLRVQTDVSADVEQIVQMVNNNVHYYYMQFSSPKAANQYFTAHYQSPASDKIKNYLQYYVEDQEVKINPDAKLESNGNILVYDENGISTIGDSIGEGMTDLSEDSKTANQLAGYQDIFYALNTNLSMDYASLTNMQKARDNVYGNLFNSATHDRRLGASEAYYTWKEGNQTYTAKVTTGDISSLTTEKSKALSVTKGILKIIIAHGNVTVNEDFDGLIICGGYARIKPKSGITSIQLNSDPALISKLIDGAVVSKIYKNFSYRDWDGKEYTLKGFMYDPDRYSGEFFTTEDRSGNYIRLEDLVVYTNWSKQ